MSILLFRRGCALACLNTKSRRGSKYWIIIPLKRFPPSTPAFQQGPGLMLEKGKVEMKSGCLGCFESGGWEAVPWMTCPTVGHLTGLQRTEAFLGPLFIWVCFQQCWQSKKDLSNRRITSYGQKWVKTLKEEKGTSSFQSHLKIKKWALSKGQVLGWALCVDYLVCPSWWPWDTGRVSTPPFFFYMHEGVDIQKLCKLLKNTQQVTDDAGIWIQVFWVSVSSLSAHIEGWSVGEGYFFSGMEVRYFVSGSPDFS